MDVIREVNDHVNHLLEFSDPDPRVKDWPLMSQPWTMLGLCLIYLYGVYVYFPNYMVSRKPYSFKTFLAFYNIFQVVVNAIIVYQILTSGWTTHYSLTCQLVDTSESEMGMRMAKAMWMTMTLKLVDFIETFIFVLRKKDNQVTVLHVFHHVSTFFITWGITKYCPGGMYSFPIILNSIVHVIMYTYYYLASLGPNVQKKLKFIKSTITTVQIIQLLAMSVQQTHGLTCKGAHYLMPGIGNLILIVDIILFLNFYKQNYTKKIKSL